MQSGTAVSIEPTHHFNGDVGKAVGAYNGGPRTPNLHYAAGVQMVAEYARNILERVTAKSEEATEEGLERGMNTDSNTSASEDFEIGGVS